jgi:hypothetical protein
VSVSGCGSRQSDSTESPAEDVTQTIHNGGVSGVILQFSRTFKEDRRVIGVDIQLGEIRPEQTAFYTPDTADARAADGLTEELSVSAGDTLAVESYFYPPCDEEPADTVPAVTVSFTRGDGDVQTDRFTVPQPEGSVAAEIRGWCDAGVRAAYSGGSSGTDGEATARYRITNPGPHDVTVRSRAGTEGDIRWMASEPVNVPAGEQVEMRVHGKAPTQGCRRPHPADLGLLEAIGPDGSTALTTEDGYAAMC